MKTDAYAPQAQAAKPAQAARAAIPSSGSLDAWHRVFEREQSEALARFRSVPVGASARTDDGASAAGTMRVAAHGAGAPETKPTRPVPAMLQPGATQNAQGAAPAMPGAVSAAPGADTQASTGMATLLASPASETPANGALTSRIDAALRTAFADASDAWPLRKLHFQMNEDGVHIWLRDARLGSGDAALDAGIAALRQTLTQAGYRLAGFTLNGIKRV